jgi:hypothetical protein
LRALQVCQLTNKWSLGLIFGAKQPNSGLKSDFRYSFLFVVSPWPIFLNVMFLIVLSTTLQRFASFTGLSINQKMFFGSDFGAKQRNSGLKSLDQG